MAARLATTADLPVEFCDVPEGAQQQALDLMAPLLSVSGPCAAITSQLHSMLAAHWMSMSPATQGTGGGMAVAHDRKIDKIETKGVDAEEILSPFALRRTKWGQLYLQLLGTCAPPSLMVV